MSEKQLLESLTSQLQELRKDLERLREAKKKQDEGHWITVNSDGGHGTHIFIKGDGTVGKGPTGLVGKKFPKAAKKAAKRPSKPSGGTGLGGTMAGTSSLPSSGGGMIDISKYQTSIPLTPAAPKAAAKPAPAPKAPKVEPPKSTEPKNIDISGYKFEMPKAKPTEAPKPAEPPKAVEPPKPLEAPKPTQNLSAVKKDSPTLPGHTAPSHWPEEAKAGYIGTIKKGKELDFGSESPYAAAGTSKAEKDVHFFNDIGSSSKAMIADATHGKDAHYLFPVTPKPFVYNDKKSAEDSYKDTVKINKNFLKHKNELNPPDYVSNAQTKAEEITNKGLFLHPVEPKKFASQAEADVAQAKDKAESYNWLKGMGISGITAGSMIDKMHPGSSYVTTKVPSVEPLAHAPKKSITTQNNEEPLDLMRYPTGKPGDKSPLGSYKSQDDADKAYQKAVSEKAFELMVNDPEFIKLSGPTASSVSIDDLSKKVVTKAESLVDKNQYRVSDPLAIASLEPSHGSWKFAKGEDRTQYIDKTNATSHGIKKLEVGKGGVPKTVAASVKRYSGSDYHSLNGALRSDPTGESMGPHNKKEFENLNNFIKTAGTLPKPVTVWRGIKPFNAEGHHVDHDELINRYANHIGKTITLNGFQSTSFDPRVAAAFAGGSSKVIFEISTRKGGYMHDSSLSGHTNEREFLLGHGWKYRVLGIDKAKIPDVYGGSKEMHIIKLEAM